MIYLLYALLAILGYAVVTWFVLWLLWVFYTSVMHIKKVRAAGELSGFAYAFTFPTILSAAILDILGNLLLTPVFLDFHQSLLVTDRLNWYVTYERDTWRGKMAAYLGKALLNDFDKDHIRGAGN